MNTGDLIGQILQSGMARGAHTRMQRGAGSQPGLGGLLGGLLGGGGSGSGGGLGDLLGGRSGSHGGGGGGLGGLAGMASDYLSGGGRGRSSYPQGGSMSGGSLGGLVSGGSLGGLVGAMLGGSRSSGMLGGAAMGVIGMIAMNALRNLGQSQPAAPAAQATPAAQPGQAAEVSPDDIPAPSESTQRLMLMAMISAAKADGHVDDAEMNNIVGKLKENGADAEERDWVLRELAKPMDLDVLVAAVPSIEVAAQVYAASALAITPDTPQEQDYLNQLSAKLGLQPAVRAYIHQALGLPAPA
ncbi:MAG TPA: tellurite resistance TerB family protein [Geminicoccus sp.]|uniref:tellurite resistance TerB family protein n=1 Tax=Geminicoccus sp. TaxID=2024832 RepID=UPI002C10BE78|nr:tellurite resistance TerB family protein [Geminicoccus sp.]HWL67347.1 tellurite resistance TerB family protein [Geminicoccus sp.]